MDNSCWVCGDPTHHARECREHVDVDNKKKTKKEIQKSRWTSGASSRNSTPLNIKMAAINAARAVPLPKLSLVQEETSRLMDCLENVQDSLRSTQNISLTTDVDSARLCHVNLRQIREDISVTSEKCRQIGWIIKQFKVTWPDDGEVIISFHRWQDLNEASRKLNNDSYVSINNLKIAQTVLSKIKDTISCISSWINQCTPQGNGRPLEFKAEKKLMKSKKTELFGWIDKFGYLYIQDDLENIRKESNTLEEKWRKFMGMINGLDDKSRKIACSLCEDEPKTWALRCGHCFCGTCINELRQERFAEGIPWIDPETGQVHAGFPVRVRNNCPQCRGTLEDAVKIFL